MNNLLIIRIRNKMKEFSKGQKLIAKYIEEHYDKVAFMTASKLGATVGVSESTVVRFATEIGYTGYPELQQAMQEMIRNKLTSVQRMEVTASRIGDADILDSVFNQDIETIRRTMEETPHEDFYRSVDAIVAARKIYILGARSSLALATFLYNYFNLIFENVLLVKSTSEGEIFEQMIRVDERDVVIGISFPRYSRKAVNAMNFAHKRGATVIAITDSLLSPLANEADYTLLARSDIASIVDSLVAPLSLINALIVTTSLKKSGELTQVFKRLEDIWDEYEVYEKVDEKSSGSAL
ncbi:MurR/RpiR family transcriptional regulator [Caproiciproducens galactitolivorans]|uniref:MurR/RpiR family transcriptional regulator n=1 Tax=Caproiciproducens galactitolivorans TaxID=642589 RepID=A0ABT4BTI4_9FIRM|nr:MurR/RpiR family transcriptional regulator [Caproiciproducens galactitolivorans]MCY1714213.1 MurR/RpiR family transcriptional regulator [Caproiciproducens galactitolivorans]